MRAGRGEKTGLSALDDIGPFLLLGKPAYLTHINPIVQSAPACQSFRTRKAAGGIS
jgi:hypothetical protein